MTTARLVGVAADTADHPVSAARAFGLLGLNVAVRDDSAEIRCDTGSVVCLPQTRTPARIGLRFVTHGLADACRYLSEHREKWSVLGPNAIRIERGGLSIEAVETVDRYQPPGLVAVTYFVSDVAATAQFFDALDLPVTDAGADAADVQIGGVTVELRAAGTGLTTLAHMVIRMDDPLRATVWLDYDAWPYQLSNGELTTRTPDGCGIRLVPAQPRREPGGGG